MSSPCGLGSELLILAMRTQPGLVRICLCVMFLFTLRLDAQEPRARSTPAPTLVVGVDIDFFPFEYGDAQGRAGGFDVDLLQAIARDEGLNLQFRPKAWSGLRQDLRDGQIDIMSGMFRSSGRSTTLAFSQPHMLVDYALFTRKADPALTTLESLRGQTVLLQESTFVHESLAEMKPRIRNLPVLSERLAIQRLAAGEGDAALVTQLGGNALIRELGLTNLHGTGLPVRDLPFCFAVPKDRIHLLGILNRGLERLRASGEYEQIRRRWFGSSSSPTFPQALYVAAWIGVPLLALLAIVLLWNRTLHRRVETRTRELRLHQEHLEELVKARTADLQEALEDVKRLSGLVPICASCKKVRDDQGYWTQVEQYVEANSEATFTHGLCPDCIDHLYPEVIARRKAAESGTA